MQPIELGLVARCLKYRYPIYEYLCKCGNTFQAYRFSIKNGTTKSCGCLNKKLSAERAKSRTRHGRSRIKDPTYITWTRMKVRCNNPNDRHYYLYGGKGITIHSDWLVFENFLRDMGERPSTDYSIDRIDPNGNYEPGNCRWVLKSENSSRVLK